MTIATASVDQNTIRRRGTGLRAYNPDKVFKGYTRMALRKAETLVVQAVCNCLRNLCRGLIIKG
jgi:hypothetical protein